MALEKMEVVATPAQRVDAAALRWENYVAEQPDAAAYADQAFAGTKNAEQVLAAGKALTSALEGEMFNTGIEPISYEYEGKIYHFEAGSTEDLYSLTIVDAQNNGYEWKDKSLQSLIDKLGTDLEVVVTFKSGDGTSYKVTVSKTESGDLTLIPPAGAEVIVEESLSEETGEDDGVGEDIETAEFPPLQERCALVTRVPFPNENKDFLEIANNRISMPTLGVKIKFDEQKQIYVFTTYGKHEARVPKSEIDSNRENPGTVNLPFWRGGGLGFELISYDVWIEGDACQLRPSPYGMRGLNEVPIRGTDSFGMAVDNYSKSLLSSELYGISWYIKDADILTTQEGLVQLFKTKTISYSSSNGDEITMTLSQQEMDQIIAGTFTGKIVSKKITLKDHDDAMVDVRLKLYRGPDNALHTEVSYWVEKKFEAAIWANTADKTLYNSRRTRGGEKQLASNGPKLIGFSKEVEADKNTLDSKNHAMVDAMTATTGDATHEIVLQSGNVSGGDMLGKNQVKIDLDACTPAGFDSQGNQLYKFSTQDKSAVAVASWFGEDKSTWEGYFVVKKIYLPGYDSKHPNNPGNAQYVKYMIEKTVVTACPGDYRTTWEKVKDKVGGVEWPTGPGDDEPTEVDDVSLQPFPGVDFGPEGFITQYDESVYDMSGNLLPGWYTGFDKGQKEFEIGEDGYPVFGSIWAILKKGDFQFDGFSGNTIYLEIPQDEVNKNVTSKKGRLDKKPRGVKISVMDEDGKKFLRFMVDPPGEEIEPIPEITEIPKLSRFPLEKSADTYQLTEHRDYNHHDNDHYGVDYVIKGKPGEIRGNSVFPASDGVVIRRGFDSGGNSWVSVWHPKEHIVTSYLHMLNIDHLQVGTKVTTSTKLGTVANIGPSGNGNTTDNNHLHWEVWVPKNSSIIREMNKIAKGSSKKEIRRAKLESLESNFNLVNPIPFLPPEYQIIENSKVTSGDKVDIADALRDLNKAMGLGGVPVLKKDVLVNKENMEPAMRAGYEKCKNTEIGKTFTFEELQAVVMAETTFNSEHMNGPGGPFQIDPITVKDISISRPNLYQPYLSNQEATTFSSDKTKTDWDLGMRAKMGILAVKKHDGLSAHSVKTYVLGLTDDEILILIEKKKKNFPYLKDESMDKRRAFVTAYRNNDNNLQKKVDYFASYGGMPEKDSNGNEIRGTTNHEFNATTSLEKAYIGYCGIKDSSEVTPPSPPPGPETITREQKIAREKAKDHDANATVKGSKNIGRGTETIAVTHAFPNIAGLPGYSIVFENNLYKIKKPDGGFVQTASNRDRGFNPTESQFDYEEISGSLALSGKSKQERKLNGITGKLCFIAYQNGDIKFVFKPI